MRVINGREYWTAHEVAAELKVSRRTVRRWIDKARQDGKGNGKTGNGKSHVFGELEVIRDPVNRYLYFDKKQVQQLVRRKFTRQKLCDLSM